MVLSKLHIHLLYYANKKYLLIPYATKINKKNVKIGPAQL